MYVASGPCGGSETEVSLDHITLISFSFQVLDPELDLRTVKHSIWKSVGDMRLFYREKEQRTDQTKIENETSKEGSVDS